MVKSLSDVSKSEVRVMHVFFQCGQRGEVLFTLVVPTINPTMFRPKASQELTDLAEGTRCFGERTGLF